MDHKMWLMILGLVFAAVNADKRDQGPQTFEATSPAPSPSPPPAPQPETDEPQYEMREVIVYLTPSQIKALESGRGYLQSIPRQTPSEHRQNIEQDDYEKENNERRKQIELQTAIENQKRAEDAARNYAAAIQKEETTLRPRVIKKQKTTPRPPPVKESVEEETNPEISTQYTQYGYEPAEQKEQYFLPEKPESVSNSYSNFNLHNKKSSDVNIKIYHPLPHDMKLSDDLAGKSLETHTDPVFQKKFKLIPYEYLNKKSELSQLQARTQEHLQSQIAQKESERQFINYLAAQRQKNAESFNYQQQEVEEKEEKKDEIVKMYAPRYNDQKEAIELQNILKKQSAKAKAEAIAKQPAVELNREVSITRQKPVHIIKHVQVQVPQPYLVKVPEPFEVKVPQPYPVPLEIIRHIPVPVIKQEKIEVERPVPYEVERRIPVPVTKKVYVKVDKPYFVERTVPVEIKKEIPVEIPIRKPQKLTILRHVWQH